ncbi:MAG: hypothetical protein IJS02_01060, partial [Bacteroidales bacterium]|nr:hypothetical protein [Bacteroidales bacterium]
KTFQSEPLTKAAIADLLSQEGDSSQSVEIVDNSQGGAVARTSASNANNLLTAIISKAAIESGESGFNPAEEPTDGKTLDNSMTLYLNVSTEEKTETSTVYEISLSATLVSTLTDSTGNLLQSSTTQMSSSDIDNSGAISELIVAELNVGKNLRNVSVTHNTEPMVRLTSESSAAAEGFLYDIDTGILVIKTKSFSPFTVHYDQYEQVFEPAFPNTEKYMYRIGNENPVKLSSLFVEKAENKVLDDSAVKVVIERISGASVGGTYTKASTWEAGTVKFENTGVVSVTIDYENQPETLFLEVVDAYNITSYSELSNRTSVLLNDIVMANNGNYYLSNSTLYGNGFTFDVTKGLTKHNNKPNISNNYVIGLANSNLDNIVVKGAVYPEYGYLVSQEFNNPTVLASSGECVISNSYISNCASPIRIAGARLTVSNSTLKGGNYANIDLRSGKLFLNDVTTINQADMNDKATDGSDVVGLGIVTWYENVTDAEITVNGLTQYNYVSSNDVDALRNMYTRDFGEAMLGETFSDYIYTDAKGVKWVNTGILSTNAKDFSADNLKANIDGYQGLSGFTYRNNEGYLYTKLAGTPRTSSDTYSSNTQQNIPPTFKVILSDEKPDSESGQYYDRELGKVKVFFNKGDIYGFSTDNIVDVKAKYTDQELSCMAVINRINGETLQANADGTYSFEDSGEYSIVYSVADSQFYGTDGTATDTSRTYIYQIPLTVTAILPQQDAEIIGETNFTGMAKCLYVNSSSDFNYCFDILEGITIKDYDNENNEETVLSAGNKSEFLKTIIETEVNYYGDNVYTDGSVIRLVLTNNRSLSIYLSKLELESYPGKKGAGLSTDGDATTLYYGGTGAIAGSNGIDHDADGSFKATIQRFVFKGYSGKEITFNANYNITGSHSNISKDTFYEINARETGVVANKNAEVYAYNSGCFSSGTLISLADGVQKPIECITSSDRILAWDFFTGKYTAQPVALLVDHGEAEYQVANLKFSDGTVLKLIGEHGVFDYDLNRFAYITPENCMDYVGHHFARQTAGTGYALSTLKSAWVTNEVTTAYSITSAETMNAFASGLLTVAPPEDFYNWVKMDGKLRYDSTQFAKDVETYGLYDYSVFADYVTYEQFLAFNGAYLKIPVEKGLFTLDYVLGLIAEYGQFMK